MIVYCVYTAQDNESIKGMNRCRNSARKYNIDFQPWVGVYFKNLKAKHEELGIRAKYKPVPGGSTSFDQKYAPQSRVANGTTHYELYLRAARLNTPIAIVEHDAIFQAPLPEVLPDNINDSIVQISSHNEKQMTVELLETCGRANKMRKYGKTQKPYRDWSEEVGCIPHPLSGTNGTSGYIIGPGAAQKMVDYIKADGVGFADRLREEHIGEGNLYLQVPQCVVCPHDIRSTRLY